MTTRLLTSLLGAMALSLAARAQTTVGPVTYGSGQNVTVLGPSTIQTSGNVVVSSGATVVFSATQGIWLNPGFNVSGGTFTATITAPPAPSFSPPAGTYTSIQSVTITSAGSSAIYYTTNGKAPTTASTLYTGPVTISTTTSLSAIGIDTIGSSPVTSGQYTINLLPAPAPVVSLAPGTYPGTQTVTITGASGTSIYYTTDGSTPTATNGTLYTTGPVTISGTTVLKIVAVEYGDSGSPVTGGDYSIASSPASVLNVMDDFTTANNVGIMPGAALIQGSDGNYYGTTQAGTGSDGTVFKMTPAGVVTNLVSFTGANGMIPCAALVQGTDGNFYGTTLEGGSSNDGTVFRLTPAGALITLDSFTGANGAYPQAALVQGSDGNFYGTTFQGGSSNDGTVFKVTPAGALTTLVSFTGANGANPQAALVQGSDGNFYGTTFYGGSGNAGTVFKLTPAGGLTTLVSFTGANGALPVSALLQGRDGNFYGTTEGGGSNLDGTLFQMTPAGGLVTLVSFNGANGANPAAGLLQGDDGNFYGTTEDGGSSGDGTVFQLATAGVPNTRLLLYVVNTLVAFDGANGANPTAALLLGNDGNFYGTASAGGASNFGVIFQLMEPLLPSTTLCPATTSIDFGQPATLTATSIAIEGNLFSQSIDYLAPGSSTWISGTTVSGANWSGGPTGSNTLVWNIPASLLNAAGTWQFRASGSDGTNISAYATASVIVAKATPVVSPWSSQTFMNAPTVTAADLNAIFGNPYSDSVIQPTGAVTYTIVSSTNSLMPVGTTITVGTVLPPGTYTIVASYPGDSNYNGYTAPPVTWTEMLGYTFQYDADGRLISAVQASPTQPDLFTLINYGLDPETNLLSLTTGTGTNP